MKLDIKERIGFAEFYPEKGNMLEMTLAKDISEKVKLTPEDYEKYGITIKDNSITWDSNKDKGIEVEFNKLELNMLKDRITELDKNKAFKPDDNFSMLELAQRIKNEENPIEK